MLAESVWSVILNYNSSQDTIKCVEWLKLQSYSDFHIIVVDNASVDFEDKQKLIDYHKSNDFFELLLSENNGGFSAGNNIGMRYAIIRGAEWILVINPDVEIRDCDYVKKVMSVKEKWADAGIIGTRTLLPNGRNQNPLRELTAFEEIAYPITYLREKTKGAEYYKTSEITGYCEKVAGCCFFVNKEFLLKNNYLDENVFMYCEEPIIAKSAQRLNYRVLYIDELTAFHQHDDKTKPGNRSARMIRALKSRKYYIKNYSGFPSVIKKLALAVKDIQVFIWKMKDKCR